MCEAGQCVPDPDPEPPETTITKDPGEKTDDRTPTFKFTSTPEGAAFKCSVDGGRYKTCESPHKLARLSRGHHTFKVRATLGGVTDPTPAIHKFKVTR